MNMLKSQDAPILIATPIDGSENIKAELRTVNEKIISVEWNNKDSKTIKETFYKDGVLIKITTENLIRKEITVYILEDETDKKVADWDKATDNDVVLKATVNDKNIAIVEFFPKDEWFSKGAKDKSIIASVSYSEKGKHISSSVFIIKKINYNKDMTVSDNGIRFAAYEESLAMICPDGKIRAYKDTSGNWTIGYGEMTGITADTVLDSKDVAFDRYKNKIRGDYQSQTRRLLFTQGVKRRLEQYEFDAIVDLVYNAWSCEELIGKIADVEEITEQVFTSFKPNNGKLIARRKAEYMLYTNQVTSVRGPKEYYRKDNTNGGYNSITKEKPVTQKIVKDGKTVEEPVFEIKDGKQVPKMKIVKEAGYYIKYSKEVYLIQY